MSVIPGGSPAPAPYNTAPPPTAQPQHVSQLLGFLRSAYTPIDSISRDLEGRLQSTPAAGGLANAGAHLRSVLPPGLVHFIDNPDAYYQQQAAQGVRPGLAGQFLGNVLTLGLGAPGAGAEQPAPSGGPSAGNGLFGGQAPRSDPDGFVWSMLRRAAPSVGPNPFAPPR